MKKPNKLVFVTGKPFQSYAMEQSSLFGLLINYEGNEVLEYGPWNRIHNTLFYL
jgi:hypothetical protein